MLSASEKLNSAATDSAASFREENTIGAILSGRDIGASVRNDEGGLQVPGSKLAGGEYEVEKYGREVLG